MRWHRSRRPPRQRGVALIVALLVFALAAVLLVGLAREFTLFYQRGANALLGAQAQAYLLGAEELAELALARDYALDQERSAPRDDLTELWARESPPYALDEGGWLTGRLEDLQGRFNLNLLARQQPESEAGDDAFTPAQRFFLRLLLSFQDLALGRSEAVAVTEAIGDWLDADAVARFNGAEDDYYLVQRPAYRAANRPMASVSELRSVANVTPALYERLAPLVTVWPAVPSSMNIHTMPEALLAAVNIDGSLEPLLPADAQALAAQRAAVGFADKQAFLEDPLFRGAPMEEVAGLLGESSNWFLLSARVEIAGREDRLYSVMHREYRRARSVLRARGSL